MTTLSNIIIDRKPETLNKFKFSKSTLHARIREGVFPPPISLGLRAVGFVRNETDQVLAAMVAGRSKDEIKILVADLVAQRQQVK